MSPRRFPLLLLCALLALPAVRAADADADYVRWQQAHRESPPRDRAERDKGAIDRFWQEKSAVLDRFAADFPAAHPQDPRRWEVGLRAVQMARWRLHADEAARQASGQRDADFLRQLAAAPDARADLVEQARAGLAGNALEAAQRRHRAGVAPDLGALVAELDDFAARYPAARTRANLERSLTVLLGEIDPVAAASRLERLAGDTASPDVASMAAAQLDKLSWHGRPFDMAFTALDGREVDLAQMRGKVVLVDFWATWCGPCMAEMPNVKAAYAKYRDHGFEVIGISLDGGGITKGIQSGVRTREDLLAFLGREQMPWPQHYDNLGWKNEFAQKFRINSIPAVFLIGRDGKVISTEAKGESLDPLIRRALGL